MNNAAFDAEIDRQQEAIASAVAALPDRDVAATPFAALLTFWETAAPLAEVGGEPVRRRFRNALESVVADVVPEMLRPPATQLPTTIEEAATELARSDSQAQSRQLVSPSADLEKLTGDLLDCAQAAETSAVVRALAAAAVALQLADAAVVASPAVHASLVSAFVNIAQHLQPGLIVMVPPPAPSGQAH